MLLKTHGANLAQGAAGPRPPSSSCDSSASQDSKVQERSHISLKTNSTTILAADAGSPPSHAASQNSKVQQRSHISLKTKAASSTSRAILPETGETTALFAASPMGGSTYTSRPRCPRPLNIGVPRTRPQNLAHKVLASGFHPVYSGEHPPPSGRILLDAVDNNGIPSKGTRLC